MPKPAAVRRDRVRLKMIASTSGDAMTSSFTGASFIASNALTSSSTARTVRQPIEWQIRSICLTPELAASFLRKSPKKNAAFSDAV